MGMGGEIMKPFEEEIVPAEIREVSVKEWRELAALMWEHKRRLYEVRGDIETVSLVRGDTGTGDAD